MAVPAPPAAALETVIAEGVGRILGAAHPASVRTDTLPNGDEIIHRYGHLSEVKMSLSPSTAAALGSSAEMAAYLARTEHAAFELNGPRRGFSPLHHHNVPATLCGVAVVLDEAVPAGVFRFTHRDPWRHVNPVDATWSGYQSSLENMRIR